jgi:hypothetical protein
MLNTQEHRQKMAQKHKKDGLSKKLKAAEENKNPYYKEQD